MSAPSSYNNRQSTQQTPLMSQLRLNTRHTSRPEPPPLSRWSSPRIPNSMWAPDSFMLGSGMVIFEVPTAKVVLVEDTKTGYWFFPKGRKDRNESLEEAALREAYEEAGYRAQLLPVLSPTRAPVPPGKEDEYFEPNQEPFYLSVQYWPPKTRRGVSRPGGEYFTSWYIGYIEEGAAHEKDTGMLDEKDYVGRILDVQEAYPLLDPMSRKLLLYAFNLVVDTYEFARPVHRRLFMGESSRRREETVDRQTRETFGLEDEEAELPEIDSEDHVEGLDADRRSE